MIGKICIFYEQEEADDRSIVKKVRKLLENNYDCECMKCCSDKHIDSRIFAEFSYYIFIIGGLEETNGILIPKLKCGNKMRFTWTYLTGRFPKESFAYLINTNEDYTAELNGENLKIALGTGAEDIAKQIVDRFVDKFRKVAVKTNKLDILNNWAGTKRLFSKIGPAVPMSYSEEMNLANRLLHSIEACYYNNDAKSLVSLLRRIEPKTSELVFVKELIELSYKLFTESDALQTKLSIEAFDDLKTGLKNIETPNFADKNLNLWFEWFCHVRLAVINGYKSINPDYNSESAVEAKKYLDSSKAVLENICKDFPEDEAYCDLYYGYFFLNKFVVEKDADGNEDVFKNAIHDSMRRFRAFLKHYSGLDESLKDVQLEDCINMEFHYSWVERLPYLTETARYEAKAGIDSFIKETTARQSQQHAKLKALIDKFDKYCATKPPQKNLPDRIPD